MRRIVVLITALVLLASCGCNSDAPRSAPAGEERRAAPAQGFEGSERLRLPEGFRIGLFASSLSRPRMMALSPDGRLFVTETEAGRVTILPDSDGNGRADSHVAYASGLNQPHGNAFHDGPL